VSTLPPGMARHRHLPCHQQSDVGSVTLPDERDKRRVEELFRRHGPDVLAYARRRTATFADAQDVLAETFLVCCRRVRDVPDDPLPWLLGVARKVLANQRRSRSRRSALYTKLENFAGSVPETSEFPSDAPRTDAVRQALAQLTDGDREALLLVAWEGLTHEQAARVLGIRRKAFTARVARARQRLMTHLACIRT
jgi:RNA polymerase sigma factor (sigma-70 family)